MIAQTADCRIEIVVIDDGSTDDTPKIMQAYAEHFADRTAGRFVRTLRQDNQGVVAARNHGLAESNAPLVAFLDSDDFWDHHKLERQLQAIRLDDAVSVVHTSFRYVDESGEPSDDGPQRLDNPCAGECATTLLREDVVIFSSVLARRSAIDAAAEAEDHGQPFAPGLTNAQDYDLLLRLARSGRFIYVPEALTFYRRHDAHGAMGNLKQAFGYHCRVQRDFVGRWGEQIGVSGEQVDRHIADFLFGRAESAFWRRELEVVRDLCELAEQENVLNDRFVELTRKASWPVWLYKLKDNVGRMFGS